MSKKHFIAAAKMADLIIAMNDNGNFDKGRFLSACGLQ
jgi:hypothetical protein